MRFYARMYWFSWVFGIELFAGKTSYCIVFRVGPLWLQANYMH